MNKAVRRCKSCRCKLPNICIDICEACREAGMGSKRRKTYIEDLELWKIANVRQIAGVNPIEGMDMVQVNAIARLYKPPYSTYGRFRAYVVRSGRLPPKEYLR